METSDMIGCLREMVEVWDLYKKSEFFVNDEIHMWRDRYIASLNLNPEEDVSEYIAITIRYIPSKEMIKEGPEKQIDLMREYYVKYCANKERAINKK